MKTAAIAGSLMFGFLTLPVCAQVTVEEIIENVKRNEALYDEIDVTMHDEFTIGDNKPLESQDGQMKQMSSQSAVRHYVRQGGLFRLERTGTGVRGSEGEPVSLDRIRAYDGTTTRLLDQNAIGNIIKGLADDDRTVCPHTIFIQMDIATPLSTFLSGHKAIAAHPLGSKRYRNQITIATSYHGETECQGLRCHEVWVTESSFGVPYDRYEFLLAEERNYLPVRRTGYTFNLSKEVPLGQDEVAEFREVEPGVWFPWSVRMTCNEPALLQREGKQKLGWEQRHTVESVSLHPQYDAAYFSDVPFPDGTAVYEVENREIKKSYRTGTPAAPLAQAAGATGRRRWTALFAVGGIAALFVLISKLRRRVARLR